jgi:hypothetical protein
MAGMMAGIMVVMGATQIMVDTMEAIRTTVSVPGW